MVRKLFIGIQIDGRANAVIERNLKEFSSFQVFWTEAQQRYITLLFLGNVDDEYLPHISEGILRAVEGMEVFDIFLEKISSGPDKNNPKSIRAWGEESDELSKLHDRLAKELNSFAKIEKKRFCSHVTLGRFRRIKNRSDLGEEDYFFEKKIHIPVSVSTVTLFESAEENGKREYFPVDVFDL
ncbi:MAG: RNA 2',3'-cyclic phosphodiesterase [Candidatus Moraniibacteriota bacterium]|nr:MAG: RNA 2',3'-cyclic phosphodiesterase [Candidatus Moranbacteria bacterium]